MNKAQNPVILLKNLYVFVDPKAKGEEKNIFHLFVVGKKNYGMFLHDGSKYFLNEVQTSSPQIVYYTPSVETNLYGKKIESKNFHKMHISNNVIELLSSENFCINGISSKDLEAIRPITREQNITLNTCRLYENLFTCVQKRNLANNTKQTHLADFCME